MTKRRIIVTAAIIYDEDKILITKRSAKNKMPGGWEFPGGKIELGESPETCVQRELKEELNIEVSNVEIFHAIQHEYDDFFIIMLAYKCNIIDAGKIVLHEHEQFKWLHYNSPDDWTQHSFMAADIPILEKLFKKKWS